MKKLAKGNIFWLPRWRSIKEKTNGDIKFREEKEKEGKREKVQRLQNFEKRLGSKMDVEESILKN